MIPLLVHVVFERQNYPDDDEDDIVTYKPSSVLVTSNEWKQTSLSQVTTNDCVKSIEINYQEFADKVPGYIYASREINPKANLEITTINFDLTMADQEFPDFCEEWTVNFMC